MPKGNRFDQGYVNKYKEANKDNVPYWFRGPVLRRKKAWMDAAQLEFLNDLADQIDKLESRTRELEEQGADDALRFQRLENANQ